MIFLGECIKWLITLTAARLKDELESAVGRFEKMREIGWSDEFFGYRSELTDYKDVVSRVMDVTRECDRIFCAKFPDGETFKSETKRGP